MSINYYNITKRETEQIYKNFNPIKDDQKFFGIRTRIFF